VGCDRVERKLHDQLRAVDEHAGAPELDGNRKAPFSAAEVRLERRTWKRPIAMFDPRGTTAKQTYWPAARCRRVQAMNRSNPSTLVGGGEMKRITSSVVSAANSAGASAISSSAQRHQRAGQRRQSRAPVVLLRAAIEQRDRRDDRLGLSVLLVRHLFH